MCVCVCARARDTTVEGTYGRKVHDEGHKNKNSTAGSEYIVQLYGTLLCCEMVILRDKLPHTHTQTHTHTHSF